MVQSGTQSDAGTVFTLAWIKLPDIQKAWTCVGHYKPLGHFLVCVCAVFCEHSESRLCMFDPLKLLED